MQFNDSPTISLTDMQLKSAPPVDVGASVDAEKKLRGFQHIIQELSAENAELKERSDSLQEETSLLKEVRLASVALDSH